jgi:hypothetical protein
MRTDEEEVLVGDWADGFFGAISLNFEEWAPLFAQKFFRCRVTFTVLGSGIGQEPTSEDHACPCDH